jgi:ribonuclease HII
MDPLIEGAAMDRYERALREQGFERVAGVDEAGRGALAGPMVAAAVILPDGFDLEGIRDSKQLTPKQRDEAFARIHAEACVAVAKVTPGAIDKRGLHRCNISLLRSAACDLAPEPDYVLTDGFAPPRMPYPTLAVKKGDAVSASIAAASIIAKVTRDRVMDALAAEHPGYGWERNRGYGTAGHRAALGRLGLTQHHRKTFRPVRNMLGTKGNVEV